MNMPIEFCSEAFFSQVWGSLTSLKSYTRDPQLKVPPRRLVLRIFTSWKNPLKLSWVWTHEPWISRRARYPKTTEDVFRQIVQCYMDVYRRESCRCHTGLPFLTYLSSLHLSRLLFNINIILYNTYTHQQSTSGPWYGVPFTISGEAYRGLPQNVLSNLCSLKTLDSPKSAIW